MFETDNIDFIGSYLGYGPVKGGPYLGYGPVRTMYFIAKGFSKFLARKSITLQRPLPVLYIHVSVFYTTSKLREPIDCHIGERPLEP